MTDSKPRSDKPKAPNADREARLAEALRANLRRRKSAKPAKTAKPDRDAP